MARTDFDRELTTLMYELLSNLNIVFSLQTIIIFSKVIKLFFTKGINGNKIEVG